jgi:peptidyl-prolyl cis-trans isomerase-like 4
MLVLHDPFPDEPYAAMLNDHDPPTSPLGEERPAAETVKARLPFDVPEEVDDGDEAARDASLEESIRRKEAASRAVVLEMTGDLPSADAKPPAEVLFVCKLNPITTDGDLEIIFGRFGPVKTCFICKDWKTQESLCYAFVEFATEAACVMAYEKMNNVLIDDRRIKVDFSQSVSKLWNTFKAQTAGRAPGSGAATGIRTGGGGGVRVQGTSSRSKLAPSASTSSKRPRDDYGDSSSHTRERGRRAGAATGV